MALDSISLENWMSELPPRLHDLPLDNLCIPGSHDSFTSALDRWGPMGKDQPSWLQTICKLFPFLKCIVYNWSRCQNLSTSQQLEIGIRYLDIRLTYQRQRICTIHGLCGQDLDSLIDDVDRFLNEHPKEIIFLDFNHFYNMQISEHRRVLNRLLSVFGSKCCPVPPYADLESLDLRTCWRYGWRVIIFYQICFEKLETILSSIPSSADASIPLPYLFWTSHYIQSPWANVDRTKKLIDFLECVLTHKKEILPCGGFLVMQGILTPTTRDVLLRPFCTLKNRYGIPGVKAVIDWLIDRGPAIKRNLNIVIVDYVETDEFSKKVIALNM